MTAHVASYSQHPLTDCALCPAAPRCWGENIAPGFLVRRHAEVGNRTPLFCQGDRFKGLYLIASGYIKLMETRADGNERVVALCQPGELVGIEGWTHERYPYAAIAAGAVHLCQLHWSRTRTGSPCALLLERLLRKTAAQLDCSTRMWLDLPAVDRVAGFLRRFAGHNASLPELPLTRSEIGSLLGLTEETVVRAMRILRQRRQWRVDGRRVIRLADAV